jgi:hypothetical protein
MRPLVLVTLVAALAACRTDPEKPDTAPPDDTGPEVVDADGDGYASDDDCDDSDASIHPGAEEDCDGVDDDCDGEIDEDATDAITVYADADGDGFGDPGVSQQACDPVDGWVGIEDASDCDDSDPAVNPAAQELCNGIDDDCDGLVDHDDDSVVDAATWYADADDDGWGDDASTVRACSQPSGHVDRGGDCDDGDAAFNPEAVEDDCTDPADYDCDGSVEYADGDGDGWAACQDCDDGDAAVSPGAAELCNGVDDDCDSWVDEDDAIDAATWYADDDGDGYGDVSSATAACSQPTGFVADATDCDDGAAAVNPGAAELCNGLDDDCDGTVDEDAAIDAATWYADADADGYGDPGSATVACSQPTGFVADATDCDDGAAAVNPGAAELCNGLDDDCDGSVDAGVCLDLSNVPSSTLELGEDALVVATDTTIDTDTGAIGGLRAAGTGLVDGIYFQVIAQASGPDLGVFSVNGLELASGATLWVEGANALVLVSTGDGDVAGTIDLTGLEGSDIYGSTGPNAGGLAVAGGGDGGAGSNNTYSGATDGEGEGPGWLGSAGVHYGNGGGGGGHCWGGGGGMGGSSSSAAAGTATAGGAGAGSGSEYGNYGGDGGDPYGAYRLEPLLAGSGGAGGLSDTDTNPNGGGGGGGAGGGALQISVDGALLVSGVIDASGGRGGDAYGGGGGGGAGGGVLLEALELDISGALYAEGGRGGHGNLSWVPSGTTGGSGGAASAPGGGAAGRESGGGGAAAGWILLRYLDAIDTSGATISPDGSSGCAGSEAMSGT